MSKRSLYDSEKTMLEIVFDKDIQKCAHCGHDIKEDISLYIGSAYKYYDADLDELRIKVPVSCKNCLKTKGDDSLWDYDIKSSKLGL